MFAVLDEVAEFTAEATVVIVDDDTPPTLFTVAAAVTSAVPLNVGLVYATSPVVDMVLPVVNALALDAVPLNVPVMVPVEKPPLTSLLTIALGVLVEVAESTSDATIVIVDELTPPTLFTVGKSADPPKSFDNFKIPFTLDVASDGAAPPTAAPTSSIVANLPLVGSVTLVMSVVVMVVVKLPAIVKAPANEIAFPPILFTNGAPALPPKSPVS